jgi:hypothetical protein
VSGPPIELVAPGTPLGSQPAVCLLATLATAGPVRVELAVRRAGRGWALEATGWLDDERPAWPTPLQTAGLCADRAALEAALADLLAAAFHHEAAVTRVRGRPWAVRCFVRAAARAGGHRYRRLPESVRRAPWLRTAPLGGDPPREGVRLKTWHARLREIAPATPGGEAAGGDNDSHV